MKGFRGGFLFVQGNRTFRKHPQHRALRMEPLEDRTLLSVTPVAADDLVLVTINAPLTIDYLTLNDFDADGDALSVQSTTNPSHGVLADNGNGSFTYTPHTGYLGQDTFTYVVTDNVDGTDTATVELIVSNGLDVNAARSQILNGVSTLFDPGSAGRIAAFGPQAAVVGNDQDDGSIIAAATWGGGRVIAMNDHQWLAMDREAGTGTDTAEYYENSIAWLAGTTDKDVKIVTYSSGESDNRAWLIDHGYTNVVSASSSNLASHLNGAAVFVPGWLGSNVSNSVLNTIANFTRAGGGLFVADFGAGYSWWWNKEIYDAPGNVLLREAGIGFPNDTSAGLNVAPAVGHIDAGTVLGMLDDSSGYTQAQLDEGGRLLDFLFDVLPPGDSLLAQLDERFWDRIDSINPTPSTPVSDPFDIALLNREAQILRDLPATEVTAHRTAEAVYGTIPADAPRVTQQVTLDTTRGRWHATGLYAAPGELVTVTVPSSLVNEGYRIRINAHTDWVGRSTLERLPYVHRSYDITSTTVQVANAFGGSIFIDFRGDAYDAPPNLGDVDVTISGAVQQPYFVLGEHTDQQWIDSLRDRPGTYGVLVSDSTIIVLPKHQIESADLSQPTALMTWWNQVVVDQDYLANRLEPRTAAEMINVDVQQSAGAAHSGYPIQAYEKHWGNPADLDKLQTSGSWGDFHELGHNHQRGWWTFSGDGEVSVNIFSNCNKETLASQPTTAGWGWSADPAQVMQRAIGDVSDGGSYSSKSDRWSFWFQLADGFGWHTYRNVFGTYESDNHSNPSNLPSNNAEEKDEFFLRWSNEVGYDMRRFMVDTWGLQVSQPAINSVDSLPDWMPVLAQDDYIDADLDQPVPFNVLENDIAMDGVIQFVGFTEPDHGQLTDDGNGDFTYTPRSGFSGTDSFSYTVRSSAGNTVTGTVELAVFESLGFDQPIDTYIHQGLPNSDRSSSNILEVDGNDSGGQVQTLLRYEDLFGPGTNQIPGHATIHSASLHVQVVDAGSAIELYRMLGSWEDTDTWNSLVDGIQTDGIEAEATSDATTEGIGAGIVEIDVTTSVQAWADHTETNHGWAMMPTGSNGIEFYSAEGPIRPRLVVSYSDVDPRLGDFNEDGAIDAVDLGIWSDGFAGFPNGDATLNDGDADADGDVDGNDFLSWQLGYGNSSAGSAQLDTAGAASNSIDDALLDFCGDITTDESAGEPSPDTTRGGGSAGPDDGHADFNESVKDSGDRPVFKHDSTKPATNKSARLAPSFANFRQLAIDYFHPDTATEKQPLRAFSPAVEQYWNHIQQQDNELVRPTRTPVTLPPSLESLPRDTLLLRDGKYDIHTVTFSDIAHDRVLQDAAESKSDARAQMVQKPSAT